LAETAAPHGRVDVAREASSKLTGWLRTDADTFIGIAEGNWDTVSVLARELMGADIGAREQAWAAAILASSYAARGQMKDALAMLRHSDSLDPTWPSAWNESNDVILAWATGQRPRHLLDEGSGRDTLMRIFTRASWFEWIGDSASMAIEVRRGAQRAGRLPAHQIFDVYRRWLSEWPNRWTAIVRDLAGPAWSGSVEPIWPTMSRWLVADAYDRLGRPDSAVAYFELLISPRRLHFAEARREGFAYSFALRRLALIYTRQGDRPRAREYWRNFLATFTNPDPELEPMVTEARSELSRLH
jgi:tetratricopeptide (TPR) repeat protein